ncbi:MAG: L,D-transpeptidase [Solirubrobacteraceae bacterium]
MLDAALWRASLRRVGLTTIALVAVAVAGVGARALASSSAHWAQTPAGLWGGVLVRSLDPARLPSPARAASSTAVPQAPRDQVLSNERTLTRWANTAAIAAIYTQPSSASQRVNRLRWYTEDGFPEVYLLLASHTDSTGHQWIKLRIPTRPNGQTGWVKREALSAFHSTTNLLVINRSQLRIYLYRNGQQRWSAPVGIGAPGTPTPPGHFWIRERFKILDRSSGYWPYALGTSDYSTLTDWPGGGVVGIHGPYGAPGQIPGRPSHGCIRMHTNDDARLATNISLGTPLQII